MRIHGSLVLITGASSGIGAATAQAIARSGGRLILLARNRSALEAVAGEIRAAGGEAWVYSADLTDPAAVEHLAPQIHQAVGLPDLIIHSAGAGRWLFVEETTPAEVVAMMAAPYFATFYVTRAFLPAMLERGSGHLAVINSPASWGAWPGATGYTAARWALRGFTEALRADLHGTGLGVTSVVPGRVLSPYFDHNPGSLERAPQIARLIPNLTPEQTAAGIVWAIEHNRREHVLPFMLWVFYQLHAVAPWLVEGLLVRTGWQHPRPSPLKGPTPS